MADFANISSKETITITFTLFAVIDILGSIPILISLKEKMGGTIRSTQATVASGAFMILFLFVGQPFLNLLGLDVQSFAVAGSIVIFIIGLEMILGLDLFKPDNNPKSGSVVPIAFPLIAGSGTLTTVMSLKADYHDVNILIGILINCIIIFAVLTSLKWIEKALGPNGLIVVRKFFGVILLAIAVKIFSSNIAQFGQQQEAEHKNQDRTSYIIKSHIHQGLVVQWIV
ncbi:MAG: MarC family protein [Ginsengibacter sp.]